MRRTLVRSLFLFSFYRSEDRSTNNMKRHKQLQPLSRQHHNGLLAVLLLKKGIKKAADPKVMAAFILHFWNSDLETHFSSEETVLIPALKETGFDETLTRRLMNEHTALRSYIYSLQEDGVSVSIIEDFAYLLEQHIRFEEKIYFPEAEKILNEEQLQKLGSKLHENNEANCMNYAVKFWE